MKWIVALSLTVFFSPMGVRSIRAAERRPAETPIVEGAVTDAAFDAHLRQLAASLPRGMHLAALKPFAVIGNQSKGTVAQHASGTIASAVRRLKKLYFEDDPQEIIDVWLFKDDKSYRHYAKTLFGDTPDTPFGYYSEAHNALIMNVGTGAGTLIHELVHPLMRANFPEVPTWFNEGLASLYECSTNRNGQIWGLTNWRLGGLKRAIRNKSLPSFKEIMAMDAWTFYGEGSGDYYAASRYLLQYLQEKGLLQAYYRAFHTARTVDPTGYQTLLSLLNVDDEAAFQKKWERWVLQLNRA